MAPAVRVGGRVMDRANPKEIIYFNQKARQMAGFLLKEVAFFMKNSAIDDRTGENRTLMICTAQVGAFEMTVIKNSTGQDGTLKVCSAQVTTVKADARHVCLS